MGDGVHGSGYLHLGKPNSEAASASLSNSKGTPLSLTAPSGVAPLSVSNSAQVAKLNASYLDGMAASAFGAVDSANISLASQSCVVTCAVTAYEAVSGLAPPFSRSRRSRRSPRTSRSSPAT